MTDRLDSCLYVASNLGAATPITEPGLAATTERHHMSIRLGPMATCLDPLDELNKRSDLLGAVIAMERGWPGSSHIRFAESVLKAGKRAWFYWPAEQAIECIDREALGTYWRLWAYCTADLVKRRLKGLVRPQLHDPGAEVVERCSMALRELYSTAAPVPMPVPQVPSASTRIPGNGVYLRTDYWVQLTSGGSYGHTSYVARELAAVTESFSCLMANRFELLDAFGLQQVVMPAPSDSAAEIPLLNATWHYYPILKVAFGLRKPAYIYERLCLGNFAAALVSRDLGIPYILEYNGSEISMSRSFNGTSLEHEQLFVRAEEAAFKQATVISVVSEALKESLIARKIDPAKIVVNPNGADTAAYAPPLPEERQRVRASVGFGPEDRVIGFSGTFGGWHGIDVLASAIPQICARTPNAKFLLIGDGSHKPMLDEAVAKNGLAARVHSAGRVPQAEGARLLGACDIFVSPHNAHMVDSKFFGSPTKLFEYMSMRGGIVASDLEQIGVVLSPALRAAEVKAGRAVRNERAVLCTPGDVPEFVEAVTTLAEQPAVAEALGRNARQAVIDHFSWTRHVEHLWKFVREQHASTSTASSPDRVSTADAYKEQVQDQWNYNPVGTQYATKTEPHTLQWFKEIEEYRYGTYAPWMRSVMEFDRHSGHDVLEIGGGVGTDLSQFASHGARVTDVDLSAGHLALAKENFERRGLTGRFVHHDAETLPFPDQSFDLVYSNGVLHHTPNTTAVVGEIRRVLRPGGSAIIMMYAEHSIHYWRELVGRLGLERDLLKNNSIGEIMSRYVELSQNDARPLVKVYSARRLRRMFKGFTDISVHKRQLLRSEVPGWVSWIPHGTAERLMGWNVIIKARKPVS
ncbi:MAG TPA: methyltransferase domain-containing protein [Vicinamibacterales bacterium]|nr:methyltransferase domain-containing protein [Vicinamibacterales bacterium]